MITEERPGTRRRRSRVLIVAALAVLLSGVALTGVVPGAPRLGGPLEGGGGTATMRVGADAQGVLWGSLILENRSGFTVTLESVAVAENPAGLDLLTQPYVWDASRTGLLGSSSVDGWALPLPAAWHLPARHPVDGYEFRSTAGEDLEVLLEFAVPRRASQLKDVTVQYRIGPLAFRETFALALLLCPPSDREPCEQ